MSQETGISLIRIILGIVGVAGYCVAIILTKFGFISAVAAILISVLAWNILTDSDLQPW